MRNRANVTKLECGSWIKMQLKRRKTFLKRLYSSQPLFSVNQKSWHKVELLLHTISICMIFTKLRGPTEVTDRSQGKDRLPDVQEWKTCEFLIRKCHFISWLSFKNSFSVSLKGVAFHRHTCTHSISPLSPSLSFIRQMLNLILKILPNAKLPFRAPIYHYDTCIPANYTPSSLFPATALLLSILYIWGHTCQRH